MDVTGIFAVAILVESEELAAPKIARRTTALHAHHPGGGWRLADHRNELGVDHHLGGEVDQSRLAE